MYILANGEQNRGSLVAFDLIELGVNGAPPFIPRSAQPNQRNDGILNTTVPSTSTFTLSLSLSHLSLNPPLSLFLSLSSSLYLSL